MQLQWGALLRILRISCYNDLEGTRSAIMILEKCIYVNVCMFLKSKTSKKNKTRLVETSSSSNIYIYIVAPMIYTVELVSMSTFQKCIHFSNIVLALCVSVPY